MTIWKRIAKPDRLSIVTLLSFAALVLIWNLFEGIYFKPSILTMLAPFAGFTSLTCIYLFRRPAERKIIEFLLYVSMWQAFPLFATLLTYLTNTWRFPLQDFLFSSWDSALGFEWMAWARFQHTVSGLAGAEAIVYQFHYLLIFASVVILAVAGKKPRNAQLFIAMALGVTISAIISGLVPAYSPVKANHVLASWPVITEALRAGERGPFSFVGIVTFPSFHAAMATMLVLAHIDRTWRLVVFGLLNAAMIFSIPSAGGHYLIDVPAGIGIGVLCWAAAQRLIASPDGAANRASHHRALNTT
jgi:membrane-associated phospholipid phosphatase